MTPAEIRATAREMVTLGASNPRAISKALHDALDWQSGDQAAARILWEHLGEVLSVGVGYSSASPYDYSADLASLTEGGA